MGLDTRALVRRITRNCSTCKILRARTTQPRMGPLPECRVSNEAYTFEHTGLDLFGPYYVAQGRARVKRYGLIFVDMCYRAIVLEVVPDMSADAILEALNNFNNRYGPIHYLYSDTHCH